MRKLLVTLALAACGGSQAKSELATAPPPSEAAPAPAAVAPAPPATPRYDVRTLFETTDMDAASFSADGSRVLVSLDKTGVYNVYAVPVAGGEPQALTASKTDSLLAVSYFPADDRFLYAADRGGDELDHLWVMEGDGKARDLTPGDKLKASFLGWSKDKRAFYVFTNERDPKMFDVYRYATGGYARTLVWKNSGEYVPSAISGDQHWLALEKSRSNADSEVYVVDLRKKGSTPKLVTKHDGDVLHNVMGFTADSRALYYGTDGAGEFRQAWSLDLASGARKPQVTAEWDVLGVRFSEDGKYRVSTVNADARTVVQVVETATGKAVQVAGLPDADIKEATFDRGETRMALTVSSDRRPPELYVVDLAGGAARRLTDNLNPKVDPQHLVDATVVRYKSYDGLEIPAILYRPRDAAPERRVPAVVLVHGGPGGQSRVGYSPQKQILANHGYAVLMVNNRGSSGYGKTFFHADDRRHGDVDLKDCVFARKYLESLDWVDGTRVAIMGGSYGGYMVVAALAFEPEAFDAGVDIFGVTNWIRTLESIPPWWSARREALYGELGDPAKEKERLRAISPLFHADKIRRPLLVIQGANDPRVLKVESDEIVAAVKKNGVPVQYVVFEDEGHGFLKKENQITAAEKYLEFLGEHLRKR